MMDDRDYMRQPDYRVNHWRSVTVTLLIINVTVFFLQYAVFRSLPLNNYFGLRLEGLKSGHVWQLITFQFLHGGLVHLLFNSLGLYFIGRQIESFFGAKRYMALYLFSGFVGGVFHVLGSWVLPGYFGGLLADGSHSPVVGASAGLSGLLIAFCLIYIREEVTAYPLLVFPVTVSVRVLLWVSVGIAVLGFLIANPKDPVAYGAHLGGMLGGWLFVCFQNRKHSNDDTKEHHPKAQTVDDTKEETDFISKEVDPILDKINKSGIQSLTSAEKKILEAAEKKMRQR